MDVGNGIKPASGQKLPLAIDLALQHLDDLVIKRGGNNDSWSRHAALWQTILVQSRNQSVLGVSPNLLKGDLAAPVGIRLDGRYWTRFETWFDRYVWPDLQRIAAASSVPPLRPARWADRKGGYHAEAEAVFFLYFDKHCSDIGSPAVHAAAKQDAKLDPDADRRTREMTGEKSRKTTSQLRSWILAFLGKNRHITPRGRWRFGVSMTLLSIFLLTFCLLLPSDSRRYIFVASSISILIVGLMQMSYRDDQDAI